MPHAVKDLKKKIRAILATSFKLLRQHRYEKHFQEKRMITATAQSRPRVATAIQQRASSATARRAFQPQQAAQSGQTPNTVSVKTSKAQKLLAQIEKWTNRIESYGKVGIEVGKRVSDFGTSVSQFGANFGGRFGSLIETGGQWLTKGGDWISEKSPQLASMLNGGLSEVGNLVTSLFG